MASRSLANIPQDAKKKLFFTSSQETHDGRPQSAPRDNFYSVRETKHVMERASSAPGGEKWGTSYTKAFDREPVFVDLEVNNSLAAMKKAGQPYVRAPHVGTSSYSTAFAWRGTPKPVKGRVLDCGAREALSSGLWTADFASWLHLYCSTKAASATEVRSHRPVGCWTCQQLRLPAVLLWPQFPTL
mmetsp:Transcript_35110/g.56282  ORF Transcript_35110/g.56282 Transcript_35110/m.56282 type:complete len:186 (-) Transcript_35110:58-615(-)